MATHRRGTGWIKPPSSSTSWSSFAELAFGSALASRTAARRPQTPHQCALVCGYQIFSSVSKLQSLKMNLTRTWSPREPNVQINKLLEFHSSPKRGPKLAVSWPPLRKRLLCGTRSLAMWSLIDIIVVTAGAAWQLQGNWICCSTCHILCNTVVPVNDQDCPNICDDL